MMENNIFLFREGDDPILGYFYRSSFCYRNDVW